MAEIVSGGGEGGQKRRRAGRMETSVRQDLRRMGKLDTGVKASLAETAVILARAIDSYSGRVDAGGSAAQLSALAKAIQELRSTLRALVEKSDDADDGDEARMSTPVWDAAQSGAADVGAADRGGGGTAG